MPLLVARVEGEEEEENSEPPAKKLRKGKEKNDCPGLGTANYAFLITLFKVPPPSHVPTAATPSFPTVETPM